MLLDLLEVLIEEVGCLECGGGLRINRESRASASRTSTQLIVLMSLVLMRMLLLQSEASELLLHEWVRCRITCCAVCYVVRASRSCALQRTYSAMRSVCLSHRDGLGVRGSVVAGRTVQASINVDIRGVDHASRHSIVFSWLLLLLLVALGNYFMGSTH